MLESRVPVGCRRLLTPPPHIASTAHWQRHNERVDQAIAEIAEQAQSEVRFCRDLSLRLWHVVSFAPFSSAPGDPQVMWIEGTDCRQVQDWLWTVVHSLKARAFALDPNTPWPGPTWAAVEPT